VVLSALLRGRILFMFLLLVFFALQRPARLFTQTFHISAWFADDTGDLFTAQINTAAKAFKIPA